MSYWPLSLSVTSSSLLRLRISTFLILPCSSCCVNLPKPGSFFLFGLEMSCWAKNARMTTMRIGNIALLEKRLMRMRLGRPRGASVAGVLARPGRLSGRSARRRRLLSARFCEDGYVRKVAVALAVVETVADDEAVRNLEADIARLELHLAPLGLRQQRADLDRGRVARAEAPQEVLQREPGVDDVLDDEDVTALERDVEILEDPHDAGGVGGRAVARDGHEVDLARDVEVAHEVREEEHRALEHADEQEVAPCVVGADLVPELADAPGELIGLDEDLSHGVVAHSGRES